MHLQIVVVLLMQLTAPQEDPLGQPVKEKTVVIEAESPLNPRDVFDSKQSASVVDLRQIQTERQARSLPEALKELPGVQIQKTGPGQGSPVIRGFTGFRTLMLIDGIRLNHSAMREGPNQYWGTVDPFLADRIDVIRGPSSVLYGSDAIGGTAYVHTISPDLDEAGVNLHGRLVGRYASAERSYTARGETSGNVGDAFGWVAGATYRDYREFSGGRHYGAMENSGYDEYGADAKLVFKAGERGRVILAGQHFRQNEAPRWHRTADSRSWHGTRPGTELEHDFDQERNLYYLQYHWDSEGGVVDAVKASLSFQRHAEDDRRLRSATARETNAFQVETYGAFLQVGKASVAGFFTAGVEYYYDNVNSRRLDRNPSTGVATYYARGPVADEASYGLLGVYLQDELRLGDLEIVGGLRFTHAKAKADEVDATPADAIQIGDLDASYRAITGSLRLLYHIGDHYNVVAGWGQGFRAPGLDDSTSTNSFASGAQDLPSADLDPEFTHTFDLGFRARYAWVEVGGFAFYTILKDFLVRVPKGDLDGLPPANDFQKDNFSDGYVYGYELTGRLRLWEEGPQDVWLFADWGYAKGEIDQVFASGEVSKQPLPKMMASTLRVGLRYEHRASRVWIEALLTAAARQSHTALSESGANDGQRIPEKHGTPGYTVYTIRGGMQVTEHVAVSLAVENVSDKDYRVHGSGQNEVGTNAVLGLDLRF
jgi:hemoglobin/transferrin/lactoferrin receptor protein